MRVEVLLFLTSCIVASVFSTLPLVRPTTDKRTFNSSVINNLIDEIFPLFENEDLAILLYNCLPNTLDTTVWYYTKPTNSTKENLDTFIITGDINALWLRDSANQVIPYIPYGPSDPDLQSLLEGLIARHADSVQIDSFANSFNFNASGEGHQSDSRTPPMTASVFEGKYEIDSLCAFFKLSYWHWRYSGSDALARFATQSWINGITKALQTIQIMQHDDGSSANPPYTFRRDTSEALDTLIMSGRGPPAHPNGLSRSLFRPSDDAVTLPYNVPGNAMACVELNHLEELLKAALLLQLPAARDDKREKKESNHNDNSNNGMASKSSVLAALHLTRDISYTLCSSLNDIVSASAASTTFTASVLPFEIDGYGAQYYMDDANVPSLLSLPLLGYLSNNHTVYQNTRKYALSSGNPYYYTGTAGRGIGGPHVGVNNTWPMAIIVQAMTSTDDNEIAWCLEMLVNSSAGTGLMHESFNVNDVSDYSRAWFAWANGLLGELILQLVKTKPHLMLKSDLDSKIVLSAQEAIQVPISLVAQREALVV